VKLIWTNRFTRDYKALTPNLQKQTDKQLRHLSRDISYPSLRVKRVQKRKGVFEGSITKQYRFLFQITTDAYILLRVGKHSILEKA